MMFHHCLKAWRALWVPPSPHHSHHTSPYLTTPHHTTPHHTKHSCQSTPTLLHPATRAVTLADVIVLLCHLPVARMESGKRTFISTSAVFVKRAVREHQAFSFHFLLPHFPPLSTCGEQIQKAFPSFFWLKGTLLWTTYSSSSMQAERYRFAKKGIKMRDI